MYQLMLDTANLDTVREALAAWPIIGVTSNPSILKKEGKVNVIPHLAKLKALCGPERILHIQVVSTTTDAIIAEAHDILARLGGDNIYIKVPASAEGIPAIKALAAEGIKVTATAVYSTMQGILAILAGAKYVAVFYNRMESNCTEPEQVIAELRAFIDGSGSDARVLAASFRNVAQITRAFAAGAQAATVAPEHIKTALGMPAVKEAIDTFTRDFAATWGEGETLSTL